MIIFIVSPKNSGLKVYRQKALEAIGKAQSKIIDARGEDVPYWVIELLKKNKKCIGLTGEDLFMEFCLQEPKNNLQVLKKIEWKDPTAIFNKPALCLLGPKNIPFNQLKKKLTIVIPSKYILIADKFLKKFEKKGYEFKKIYMNGCVESACTQGISDIAIDIVYTGSSLKKDNLTIYEIILKSDFVIIGKGDKND